MNAPADKAFSSYSVLMGLLSAALYSSILMAVLFLVPVLIVEGRRGYRAMLGSLAVSAGALSVVHLGLYLLGSSAQSATGPAGGEFVLLLLALLAPLGMLGSLILVARPAWRSLSFVSRCLAAALLSIIMALPGLLYIQSSGELQIVLGAVQQQLHTYLPAGSTNQSDLTEVFRNLLINFYGVSLFLWIFVSLWLSSRMVRSGILRRAIQEDPKGFEFKLPTIQAEMAARGLAPFLPLYRVPPVYVWPLLVSWAILLFSRFISIGYFSALAWNTALVLLICYAVQGLAVVFVRMLWTRLAPAAGFIVTILLLLVVVGGRSRQVVSVALALLGTLETWLALRIQPKGD